MADDVAKVTLTIDASPAEKGAEVFDKALNKVDKATERTVASMASQLRMVDRYIREHDKAGGQIEKFQRQIDNLNDVMAKVKPAAEQGSQGAALLAERAARAAALIQERFDQTVTALVRNKAEIDRLTKAFDPATASAQRMTDELRDLNKAFELGINIEGGYSAAYQKIVDKYDEGAQAAQRAAAADKKMLDDYVRGLDPLGAAVDAAKERVAGLQRLIAGGGPDAARATKVLPAAQDELTAARAKQVAGDPKLLAERKALTAEFDQATAKMEAYLATTERIQRAEQLGILTAQQATEERKKALGVLDGSTEALKKQEEELKRLTVEFAPLKTAQENYHAALDRLDKAKSAGIVNDKEAEVQRTRLTKSFEAQRKAIEQYGHSSGQAAFAQRQLGVQFVQFFSSIEGGMPLLQALIQQGHQAVDVAIATGTGFGVLGNVIKSAFGYLVSPIGLMLAATAALVGMAVAAERTQQRLVDLKNHFSAVRPDWEGAAGAATENAKRLAATTDLSAANARVLTEAIYSAPQFQGTDAQFLRVGKIFNDLSKQLNESTEQISQRAKQAFEDPAAAAAALQGKIATVTPELARYVRELQESGKQAQATNVLMKALADSTIPVKDNVTELHAAWTRFENALYGHTEGGRSFIEIFGGAIDHLSAKILDWTTALMGAAAKIADWVDRHGGLPNINPFGGNQFGATPWSPLPPSGAEGARLEAAINASAAENRLDPEFLRRLQGAEGVWTGSKWKTSPTGRIGAMQIDPKLLAGMQREPQNYPTVQGVTDLTDTGQNVAAGAAFLKHCLVKYGDPFLAILAYNMGETAFDKVMRGEAKPTAEAVAEASKVLSGYQGRGLAAGATSGGPQQGPQVPGVYGPTLPEDFGARSVAADRIRDAQKVFEQGNEIREQLRKNTRDIETETAGLQEAVKKYNAARVLGDEQSMALAARNIADFQRRLRALQGERTEILTPQQRATREAQEANVPLGVESGAARQFRELEVQQMQRRRQYGEGDPARELAERTELQKKLTAEMRDSIHVIDLQVAAENRLIPAYELGGQAAVHLLNHEKALIEARKYAIPDTDEYRRKVDELTAAYDRASVVDPSKAAAEDIARMRQESEQLDLQLRLITATNAERERQMAMLQERQARGYRPGEALPLEVQRAVNVAGDIADQRIRVQQAQAAYQDLARTGEQVFGTLEKAFTEPLREGETAAMRFRETVISVLADIEKELLKLLVINPILNSLFGGQHRPELGDLGNLGGGDSGQGGGSGGGIIGNLVNSVGGKGFFQGGGLIGSLFGGGGDGMASGGGLAALSSEAASNVAAGAAGLHGGGLVGYDPPSFTRLVDRSIFANAPRLHSGLGANEFAAILEKGERVLTGRQQQQVAAAANSNSKAGSHTFVFNFPHTTNPDAFRRSATQVASHVGSTLQRTQQRGN
jgi:hypothetical protein